MTGGRAALRLSPESQKAGIAVLMALLTVLGTAVATLQQAVAAEAAAAERSADLHHHEADSAANRVQTENAREYMVYRYWYEQRLRATTAADHAGAEPDPAAAEALWARSAVETKIEDWLEGHGVLFASPWIDAATEVPDFAGFYGRSTATVTRLGELADRDDAAADAWQTIAGAYVTVLTIIALALFFLGLSASLGGRKRWVLAAAGAGAAVVAAGWTLSLVARPVHVVPVEAVEAYVRSATALAGLPDGLSPTVEARLGEAAAAADEAIRIDPGYGSAKAQAALVATVLADRHTFQPGGDPGVAERARTAAMRANEALVAEDDLDADAWWNLGYLRYFAGDAAGAVQATSRALAIRPGVVALELNLAYARLATGDPAGAAEAVDSAIAHMAEAPLGEALWVLDEGDADLGRLLELRAPAERPGLAAIRARLRAVAVSLRVRGLVEPASGMPDVGAATASTILIDPATGGRTIETLAAGAAAPGTVHGIRLRLAADAEPPPGAILTARAWVDGREDLALQTDLVWPGGDAVTLDLIGPYGAAGFAMTPGAYAVELYLDGDSVGSFAFTIGS